MHISIYYLSWKEAQRELKTLAKYLWQCLDPEGFVKTLNGDEALHYAFHNHIGRVPLWFSTQHFLRNL